MVQEIQYKGYTANPSDYENTDGDMAAALNLIHEDSQLKPIFQPKQILPTGSVGLDGMRLVCIHKTAAFTHYVFVNAMNNIAWIDSENTSLIRYISTTQFLLPEVLNATAIGNTLCVVTAEGVYYYLWTSSGDSSNPTYVRLSNQLPEFKMSFGLQCSIKASDLFYADFEGTKVALGGKVVPKPTEDGIDDLTSAVLAKVNKFIADDVLGSERFCMPFYVRYAYRLFDGSLTRHSAPILMLPTSGVSPIVVGGVYASGSETDTASTLRVPMKVFAPACKLDMACVTNPSALSQYSDIIKSVDIFISAPIYSYDQSGECKEFGLTASDYSFGVYSLDNIDGDYSGSLLTKLKKYGRWSTVKAIQTKYGKLSTNIISACSMVKLPTKGEGVINSEISTCSNFYFLKSIPIEELTTTREVIEIDKGYLNALNTREAMTDDYDSHDRLIPDNSFAYNSRLILSGLKKNLFAGYFNQPYAETRLVNFVFASNGKVAGVEDVTDSSNVNNDCFHVDCVHTYIKRDGKTYVMQEEPDVVLPTQYTRLVQNTAMYLPFFYHPDGNAYKAVLYCSYTDQFGATKYWKLSLPLKRHDTLNGAYYFDSFAEQTLVSQSSKDATASSEITHPIANKIYVSEVNNPFYFPVLNIVSVGTGEVIGVSTAAQALSQGQFGAFPLYAFTTDGVWALEVSNTGTFSARQPITRDVCINRDSITQIDSSVLFVTDRGIMMIAGSTTRCVSDDIFSQDPFNVLQLPQASQLHALMGHGDDNCLPTQPFLTFLKECRMIYDYIHQHVIVYNPSTDGQGNQLYNYAYVISNKSMAWGMMRSTLKLSVNAYPGAVAMTHDNKVVSFSDTDEQESKGFFVTRPLKLGDGNVQKSVRTIIQRGHFQRGDVNTVLYGSRDLYNWFLIGSSTTHELRGLRGSPYKYFRIAGVSTLTEGKSIFGASVEFVPKFVNNLH